MTFNEFKCWLEGFTDNWKDVPRRDQWDKIREKLNEVAEPIQVPTYWPLGDFKSETYIPLWADTTTVSPKPTWNNPWYVYPVEYETYTLTA